MESTDVMVRGVSHNVTDVILRELFSSCGEVTKCIILPKNPLYDNTMAFVGYGSRSEAETAVTAFHGFQFAGHKLSVQIADKKPHSKSASTINSPEKNVPETTKRGGILGMGRGGSTTVATSRSNAPARFPPSSVETGSPRPALLKTPPPHTRLSISKDQLSAGISERLGNDTSALVRKGRLSEPVTSYGDRLNQKAINQRKSEFGGKPFNAGPSRQLLKLSPPKKSFSKGEKVNFFVDISSLKDLNSDISCQIECPDILGEVHNHYDALDGKGAHTRVTPPTIASYVAAPYDQIYFRAHVLSYQNEEVKVLFIDYGNEEVISIKTNHVYPLDEQHVLLRPAMFVKCRLGNKNSEKMFEDKINNYDPSIGAHFTVDGEVMEYDEMSKVCTINMDTDASYSNENGAAAASPPPTGSKVDGTSNGLSLNFQSFVNYHNYLNKETCCQPKEFPAADFVIVTPMYLANEKASAFDNIVGNCSDFESTKDFKVGDFVCAPYYGSLFRAIIKSIQGDKAVVYFLDYGNVDVLPLSSLRKFGQDCPKEVFNESALAIPCKIAGIKPAGGRSEYSDKCKLVMEELLTNGEIFIQGLDIVFDKTFDEKVLLVNMYSSEVPSFAEHLIQQKLVDKQIDVESVKSKICSPPRGKAPTPERREPVIKRVPMLADIGDNKCTTKSKSWVNVGVVHVESPLNFFVVDASDVDNLQSCSEMLSKEYSVGNRTPIPHSELKIGAVVVAYSTEYKEYYRGTCIRFSVNKGKIEVHYIDFGNQEILPLDNVFAMDEQFIKIPPLALKCAISGVGLGDFDASITGKMREVISSNNEESITMRIEELTRSEDAAMPVKAIVDVRIKSGKFGSKSLASMLGLADASVPSSPQKPVSNQASNSSQKSNSIKADKLPAPTTVQPTLKTEYNSPDYHTNLEARIKALEEKLVVSNNRIFELEQLVYALTDMAAKSVTEKEA